VKPAARTPRKEPRQSRARPTVEATHEAALQVLGDVGYEKLTTIRVAARASVSVGTFYQYDADKDSLARALVVAYLARVERAMKAVLEEDSSLPTLARHFVRRFITFKLEGGTRGEALRLVFMSGDVQAIVNEATASVVAILAQRIRAREPRWPEARVLQVASMWPALVFGATSAMMDRAPELVAEPWFGESLEYAVVALLNASAVDLAACQQASWSVGVGAPSPRSWAAGRHGERDRSGGGGVAWADGESLRGADVAAR
jgi:AcrR family transcriptional regulator